MNREKQFQQYKKFIENCTTVSKSINNYSDFKRINECLALLFPEKKDISILDFDDAVILQRIIEELLQQEEFVIVNNKGNNQYSNTLKYYLRFLYAKRLFSAKEKTVVENASVSTNTPLQTIYYGTPGSGKSHSVNKLVEEIYPVKEERDNFVFRTTFHPDSDYASFVGCYKPVMKTAKERKVYKSFEDLKEEAKYIVGQPSGNKVEQIVDFVTKYANLFNDIIEENADVKSLQNLLNKHFGFSNETYLACIVEYVLGKQNLNKESKISYEFTPQAFTKAYVKAWQNKEKPVYLIIEEINRGNCAQIFGDIFQLLDRKNGVSEYPIDADNDLKDYLEREDVLGVGHEGIANGKLKLPDNLNILATMNTSDQSLFPMDSAFKRRWSWECVPVKYKHSESGKFTITIDNKSYKWHDFLKEVNQRIVKATDSEDKQMGNFFITQSVKEDEFVDKVMFYLWNDVCKEEFRTKNNFFRNYTDDKKTESEEFSFNDLFDDDRRANLLSKFMEYIGIEPIKTDDQTEEVKTEE